MMNKDYVVSQMIILIILIILSDFVFMIFFATIMNHMAATKAIFMIDQ